jgi:hypothetical protein
VVKTVTSARLPPIQPKARGKPRPSQSDSATGASRTSVATEAQASRESQLVRHCENAFTAFFGLPRWKVAARRPATASP